MIVKRSIEIKLLLVEDDKRMAQALCEILRLEKYEVDHCADGLAGFDAVLSNVYDIIILDVLSPGINDFEIAKKVRQKEVRISFLMLTVKGELDDKVTGLDKFRYFL